MLSQPTSTRVSAKLTITGPHNFSAIEFLTSNDNLLVGSSSRCRLCLDGGSVSPIHCLLKLVDEQLYVQEWSMSTGTQVDGKRVEGETAVPRSSTIALGDYRIRYVLVCDDSPFSEREQPPADEWAEKQSAKQRGDQHFPCRRSRPPGRYLRSQPRRRPGVLGG
jgi:predicted component of type VI protein secretion system